MKPIVVRVKTRFDVSHHQCHDKQCAGVKQPLRRLDQEGLKDAVEQGLVYFEREERELHMLLFPEVLQQVSKRLMLTLNCSSRIPWAFDPAEL